MKSERRMGLYPTKAMGKYDFLCQKDLPWNKLKNASVLVTGGNGLIASDLIVAILELSEAKGLNTQVYALCRNENRAKKRFETYLDNPGFHLLIQDVTKELDCDIPFDFIIHAASSAHPAAFNTTPVDVMEANFIGSLNLLKYTVKHGKPRFMYVSSSEVYGENFEGKEIFTESDLGVVNHMRFRACYPESKRASETLALCFAQQYHSDVVIVRPAFIYGKEIVEDNQRADAYFMRQALNHEDIVMYSDGRQIRSYCYVNDCVSGMLYALLLGESGEIYNIGNNKCVVTMKEYAEKMAAHSGIKVIMDPSVRPQDVVFLKTTKLILDTTKLEKLGWKPNYSLDDGFKEVFGGKYNREND